MSKTPTLRSRSRRPVLRLTGCLVILGALLGCENASTSLALSDLTPDEHLYLTRVVVLERAKATALIDLDRGLALLDSLRLAWGDSSRAFTLAAAPNDPARAALVGALLSRVLVADQDSMALDPTSIRLDAPLPDPPEAPAVDPPGG